MNLDGSGRRIAVQLTSHSFGLVVDGDYIYWTDWLSRSIHRSHKRNATDTTVIRGNYGGLMEVQIYDKNLQKGRNMFFFTIYVIKTYKKVEIC